MPARNEPQNSFPERDPNNHSVPSDVVDDDALWMLLNTYIDGEATAEEILRVESLLGSRPDVAREFSFLELTSHSVREFTDIELHVAMTNAIYAATTRRKTFAHRLRTWWSRAGSGFGPTPLRLAACALASGVLITVLWPRHGVIPAQPGPANRREVATTVVRGPHPSQMPVPPVVGHPIPNTVASTNPRSSGPPFSDIAKLQVTNLIVPDIRHVPEAKIFVTRAVDRHAISKSGDGHADKIKKPDGTSIGSQGQIAKAEERHMAADNDKGAKPDDLGPDVDASTSTKVDPAVAVETTPASASQDVPPTTTLTAVSYKPGSLSDKTRNAPPSVQSLYMRTQEAIKRQHELQQYGGYGKDAYNNIQRGEVGVSLVGGRF